MDTIVSRQGERSERVIRAIRCCSVAVPPSRAPARLAARVEDEDRRGGEPGRCASITMEADFCVETLEEAIGKYGKPKIFNSDQGSQFTG
jgi:hypothetical protein